MAISLLHSLVSKVGFSLGGHSACLKNGCNEYCGYSPTETMLFWDLKDREAKVKVESNTPP